MTNDSPQIAVPTQEPADQALKPGDSICWVQSSARGRSFSMRRREGHLVGHLDGGMSQVRISKGKVIEVATDNLLPGDAKPLMKFVEALAAAHASQAVQ